MNILNELKYRNIIIDERLRTTRVDMVDISGEGDIVPVIKYKAFEQYPDIIHGFSTRLGGVSVDYLYSLNLSFSRGDDIDNVITNNLRFAKALGYDFDNRVFSDQVHDTKIYVVDEKDKGKGVALKEYIKNIDGLVTNVRDIPLITFYADCVPLYFYDKVKSIVGLAHSGWKGTVNNIAAEMIKTMKNTYGSNTADIITAIGPSICMDCYEVSHDVAEQFISKYSSIEISQMLEDKGNGKYQLNLHQACRFNLLNAGILEENISMPDICTCCNPEVLYSHRASNGLRGNLAAVIMLK